MQADLDPNRLLRNSPIRGGYVSMNKINDGITITGGKVGAMAVGPKAKAIYNERKSQPSSKERGELKGNVDIAIISVREDEFRAVHQRFKTERRYTPGGLSYYMSRIKHGTRTITRWPLHAAVNRAMTPRKNSQVILSTNWTHSLS